MKTRLFIGNLAPSVTESDLKDKFAALLSSHKEEAELGNVEVRCKNEDNYFGYVDIYLKAEGTKNESQPVGRNSNLPIFMRKYIDLMNNTKWKGSLIKVQVAKESFIDKLKREQAQGKLHNSSTNSTSKSSTPLSANSPAKFQEKESSSEQSRNQQQANAVLYKMNRSKERMNKNLKTQTNDDNKITNCGFEVVARNARTVPKSSVSPKKKKKSKRESSSGSSDDSDDDVRGGIPKFKGLLACYPDGFATDPPPQLASSKKVDDSKVVKSVEKARDSDEEDSLLQQKLLSLASQQNGEEGGHHHRTTKVENAESKKPTSSSGINIKRTKQEKSDLLRLQSLEKMKDLNTQRKNLIKTSLSSISTVAAVTDQRKIIIDEEEDDGDSSDSEPQDKKAKMVLFDESENESEVELANEDDEGDTFKIKKQFEGAHGQRLLELKTRWGNDDRFKIDSRFKDDKAEDPDEGSAEQEKAKQFNILTNILGKTVTSSKKEEGTKVTGKKVRSTGSPSKDTSSSSVIMQRYDPEAEEEEEKADVEGSKELSSEDSSPRKKSKKKDTKTESEKQVEDKPIRSSEPSTFKTVSNLKALFSTSDNSGGDLDTKSKNKFKKEAKTKQENSTSFSLLAAFGKAQSEDSENDDDDKPTTSSGTSKSKPAALSAGPRNFWQTNPFKYDSSDDEEDSSKKVKITVAKNVNDKTTTTKPETSNLLIHGKVPFFFSANDPRFEGLHDYFLKDDPVQPTTNDVEDKAKEETDDYSQKRQELKSIVKAKIKNARRKDEKRTLAIKRAMRKRKGKRKLLQKNK